MFNYLKHKISRMIPANLFGRSNLLRQVLNIGEFAGSSHGLSDLLMYAVFIKPDVILQTDGSFICCFNFHGADLESSDDDLLNILSTQLNTALNLLGSGFMIGIDTIRVKTSSYIDRDQCHFNQPLMWAIDDELRESYTLNGCYYENNYILTITYKPPVDLGSKLGVFFKRNSTNNSSDRSSNPSLNKFSDVLGNKNTFDGSNNDSYTRSSKELNYGLSEQLEYFIDKTNEVTALLSDQLHLQKLSTSQLLSYLSGCITSEQITLTLPKYHSAFIKHFLASKDITCGDGLKVGDMYTVVVSVMGFPNESYPGILDRLNNLGFEYRFNTRFIYLDNHQSSKMIERLSDLWYQKRVSAIDTLKMSLAIDSNIKVNQHAEYKYKDAEQARALSDSGEVRFGFYTATILLSSPDQSIAQHNAEAVCAELRNLGFQSQIERYHTLEAWLGSLPGYAYANIRKWLIHSKNLADMLPNTAVWSGLKYNPCSFYPRNSPPLFYATTTGSTPLRLSLHTGDNGHTLILGATGSGKSTLLNFIISQHFKYKNAKVFVFDKNHSSLPLCYALKGVFYDLGSDNNPSIDNNNLISFQPLACLEQSYDFEFCLNWLEQLCLLNGMQNTFNDNHRFALRKALNLLKHETKSQDRTLSYFRYLVQDYDKSIANILMGFSQDSFSGNNLSHANSGGGFMQHVFDGKSNNLDLFGNAFSVFEMSKVMEFGDRLIIPLLQYLIHIISKQFIHGSPSLIVFDESFLFFNHPLFRQKIIEWIKTARKFNVAIVFATQELNDLFRYPELKSALLTNCVTKIFLPNKQAQAKGVYEHYLDLGLNDKQIKLISHANIGDYFYVSELGKRKFNLNLKQNPITYHFTAKTSVADIKIARDLYRKAPTRFISNWLNHFQVSCKDINAMEAESV